MSGFRGASAGVSIDAEIHGCRGLTKTFFGEIKAFKRIAAVIDRR